MKLEKKTLEKLRDLINEETEYRTGPKLVRFFNSLGFRDSYGNGFPSRWIYTDDRLDAINGTLKLEECIKHIFSPVNFIGKFAELDQHIKNFNEFLAFDEYKLERNGKDIFIKRDTNQFEETTISEDEFLNREFKSISLESLKIDGPIIDLLKKRLDEIKKCLTAKASLAVIFLCGSTLEGILLGTALNNPEKFNRSQCAPKKDGKIKAFYEWGLAEFIDVAYDLGLLGEDVKKFSHTLRDFRNYIHPYEQMSKSFSPHEHTAKICWQVLQAAIYELSK